MNSNECRLVEFLRSYVYQVTVSFKFKTKIKSSVKHGLRAVVTPVFFSTRKFLPSIHKGDVPSIQQSMVVYEYLCRCDCRYVGNTSLRLNKKINEHVPNFS